jgi:hypothetical protein
MPNLTLYQELKEIAVPIGFFVMLVMQNVESRRAKKVAAAAQRARDELAKKMEEQKQAALDAANLVAEKLEQQNQDTAQAAREVKLQLDKAAVVTQIKMEEIHVDVNSKMGAQKKKTWEYALAIVQRPGSTPEDQANARAAEKDYMDHMEAQARADERVRLVKAVAMEKGII